MQNVVPPGEPGILPFAGISFMKSTPPSELEHCKTDVMLAGALTKLAPASVVATLHEAMHGEGILAPPVTVPHGIYTG